MKLKAYLAVSGAIFALVAVLHLLRIVFGWQAVIGGWSVPMWLSWLALAAVLMLCFWAFGLAQRDGAIIFQRRGSKASKTR